MKKFLVPMALAIALTASGSAFAGSTSDGDSALYGTPNPFAAIESPALMQQAYAGYQDPRINAESQQASMTYVSQHQDWANQDRAQPAPAANDGFHDPE